MNSHYSMYFSADLEQKEALKTIHHYLIIDLVSYLLAGILSVHYESKS